MTNMDNLIIFGARHLTVVMILIAFAFFLKLSRTKKIETVVFAAISLPIIFLAARIAALLYFNPRPFVVGNFTPLIEHAVNNGFPSDHTLLSVSVATITFYFNKKVGLFLFVLAVLVGTARVLAGVHHAVDIAGSLVIAILISLLVYKWIFPKVLRINFLKDCLK